ncbi:tRNA A-37 threonylcarbamoyl transferase component Bud32 [Streptomyces sp. LBL]|uniref:serine/threonine-protein kinase n=1 Tax=Streptomyces sp. LBL TaxID=2940562 RepID=UPI0024764E47|nr:serine/threonine-protein kinase [Streptomyces sp. LBL]MDH6623670.1 tRNA A-37 threonylcarbamoyl transferase component Bud32 [Streptomyces sp. LBL]
MQGQLLAGRYRLADPIGAGGMGRVWRAHDEVLHRAVAIKELTAALYVSEADRTVLLARTRAEARAAARINHSAVVTVHDVLDHDGRPWIVMELVEGHSLADAVKEQGRVEPLEAARIGLWVLRALRAAHSAGVLHRDVKPGNVLLGRDGRVLLTDFGIAQIEGDTTITRTGEVVGSVDYLAPERIRGHDPGASSDLWALGATLYTAVEGRSPFRRTTPLTTMQAVVEEEPAEPRYAGPLAPVITALLSKDPAVRPDMAAAEQMLAEAAEGRRSSAAQAYVPTRHEGSRTVDSGHMAGGPVVGGPMTGGHMAGSPEAGGPVPGGAMAGGPVPGGAMAGGHMTGGPMVAGPMVAGPMGSHTTGSQHTGSHQDAAARSGANGPVTTPATGTPYPGATGPTVLGPAHHTAIAPTQPPKRRRLRVLALVVALATIIGGGMAVGLKAWDEARQREKAAQASDLPTPTGPSGSGQAPEGGVPASWVRRDDPVGFSLYLPKGWERKVFGPQGDFQQIDYTPDGGRHFVRIAIDESPDFADAKSHQEDLEQQLQKLVDYQQVTMAENTYRDCKGSLWEYTWTALAKDPPYVAGPRHAIEQMYFSRDGVEYAIYLSSPEKDWEEMSKQFKWILQGWQQPL